MLPSSCFLASILSLASLAVASTCSQTLTVANADISPDGFSRKASVVNGGTVGPVIWAKKGEQLKLNVVNNLTDPGQIRVTTMHWHGILQRGTNFMDGTAGVTQCPIAPGDSFLYNFKADVAGTYWYHSHIGLQYCDGVRGALIVQDPADHLAILYDVDDESTIITISEWYHKSVLYAQGPVSPDATLINGRGRFPGGPNADLSVVNVQQGKRYRLRIISMSCEPNYIFSIDGHNLTIIETDATPTSPHTVNAIQIFAGQRYSLVLNANQRVDNYWIRALSNMRNLSTTFENGIDSAILRYRGAPIAEPKSIQPTTAKMLEEKDLHPLAYPFPPGLPGPNGADMTFNLTFSADLATGFFVNNNSYVSPTVPVLLQILSGAHSAHDLLPHGSVFTIERNKVVQVNMQTLNIAGPHPMHLHGHTFSVVKSAGALPNYLNPIGRDVVSLGMIEGDYVSIRFRTDNPGPWILHCHINPHLDLGFAVVFAEALEQTPFVDKPPKNWDQLCPTWDSLPDPVKTTHPNSTSA